MSKNVRGNCPFESVVRKVRDSYDREDYVPLHVPSFVANEANYLKDCVASGFVSSVGEYVGRFEESIASFTGAAHAVATVNGTTALRAALSLLGVRHGDLVLTQPVTFVATANAIVHAGATPAFVDTDTETLGMSPQSLESFIEAHRGPRIAACVPVHVFGHVCHIPEIVEICHRHGIPVIEDAAEALGSYRDDIHAGLFGDLGILSFNGNKTITTGGGGMMITNDENLAARAKYVTTTAKRPHPWEYFHDEVGFNYRLPNINAALGVAQMESLPAFLEDKRKLAEEYRAFFETIPEIEFITEPHRCRSNYWLNAIKLPD